MAYQLKDGNGSLFNNDRKEKDTHPDLAGSIMLNGKEYWLSGWKKQGSKGEFISIALGQEKKNSNFKAAGSDELPKNTIADDENIPF